MHMTRFGMLCAFMSSPTPAGAQSSPTPLNFDIPRQTLSAALTMFARESGFQVARFTDIDESKLIVNSVAGTYTVEHALDLILAGTGYRFRFVNDHTIAVYRSPAPLPEPPKPPAPAPDSATSAHANSHRGRIAAFVASLIAAFGVSAWADDAGNSAIQTGDTTVTALPLEEVIVTARRREERLQDVPLSVTAFTAEKLEALDLHDTTQIARYTPGLEYSGFSDARNDRGASRQLVFRGLDLASNSGISAGALTFLDGAPVLGGEVIGSLDTERVEVLRGPQNVYFGRSTFTGAVNYVTKAIPKTWSGQIELEEAQYATQNLQASAGGPITDTFRVRFTGVSNYTEGDYRNDFNPSEHLGTRNTAAGSGAFEFDPIEQFTAKGYVSYEADDDGAPAVGNVDDPYYNCAIGGSKKPNYYCGALPGANQISTYQNTTLTPLYKSYIFFPPLGSDNLDAGEFNERYGLQRKLWSADLHLNYTFDGGITLSTLSAYHLDHDSNVGDGVLRDVSKIVVPPGAITIFQYGFNEKFTDLSNEIRLTSAQNQPLRWTVGASSIHVDQLVEITAAFVSGGATFPLAPTYDSVQKTDTYGFFAGGYYDFLDNLTLSAEGRYQRDNETSGSATAEPRLYLSKLYQSFQPRVSLDWKVTPNLTPYVSYAAGTRPGGFNAILVGQPASVVSQITAQTGLTGPAYDEEKLNTYEIGVKGSALDHRISGSIDAYFGHLTNMQISQTVNYTPPTGGIVGVNLVSNLGRVQIDGLEAEGAWRVIPSLTTSATFAYNKTKILTYPCTACLATIGTENVNGNSLPLAPTYSASFAVDYTHRLAAQWTGFAHADYVYRGKRWEDFENLAYISATNLVNVRVGGKTDHLTAELFVTNLTDNSDVTGAQRLGDTVNGLPQFRVGLPDKRTFGGRFFYRFR